MKIAVLSYKDVSGWYAATLIVRGAKSPSVAVAQFMHLG
jgi:hypothetical protein